MADNTNVPPADFAETQGTALPGNEAEPGPAGQDVGQQRQHGPSDVTAWSPDPGQQRTRTIAEIEAIAVAARAAWHSAEQVHRATLDQNRAFQENFKKIVAHNADTLKELQARFEQSEQRTRTLVLKANRLIGDYQVMAARFNTTTRRLALSAFAIMLILLVLLEISWWVS